MSRIGWFIETFIPNWMVFDEYNVSSWDRGGDGCFVVVGDILV